MVANDDSESVPSDESDALDEVALASVNQALEAVENEAVVEEAPQEEETPQPPRNVIPELEDVEDPEEMVQVLLTVGEETQSTRMSKVSCCVQQGHALDPMRHGVVQQRRAARGPTGCSWARQSFQICLDLNDHTLQLRRTSPFYSSALVIWKVPTKWQERH